MHYPPAALNNNRKPSSRITEWAPMELNTARTQIREAIASDFAAIAGLLNKSFEVESEYLEQPPEDVNSVAKDLGNGIYLVAADSHGLVGCVHIDALRRGIFKLAVRLTARRKGYGRKLMAAAEEHGKGIGWTNATIAIVSFRTELPKFYREIGYVETGVTKEVMLDPPARVLKPCCLILMTKNLI
jgi:GNAT superfamily N-acetyltransferase